MSNGDDPRYVYLFGREHRQVCSTCAHPYCFILGRRATLAAGMTWLDTGCHECIAEAHTIRWNRQRAKK